MKIGISGSFCCGKTTLCESVTSELIKLGFNVKHTIEPSRKFKYEDLKLCNTQLKIFLNQIYREISCRADIVITDTTVIDNYIYYTAACKYNNQIIKLVRPWINTYDIIFFSKTDGIPLIDDGFRPDNNERLRIEKELLDFYKYEYVNNYVELTGNEDERRNKIINTVIKFG